MRAIRTVDADAHVIETAATFEYMSEADRRFAPIIVTQTSGDVRMGNSGGVHKEHWLVDNTVHPKDRLGDIGTPDGARDMTNIDRRLKHWTN